jgi:hypothetical protein
LLFLITIPAVIAVSLAAFAIWTTSTQSQQQIGAGSGPAITLSSTSPNTVSNNGETLTFSSLSGVENSFSTGDEPVLVSNTGAASATVTSASVLGTPAVSAASTAFNSEVSVCVFNLTAQTVEYNGLLTGYAPSSATLNLGTIAAAGSASYSVNVYAGTEQTLCGSIAKGGQNYSSADETSTAPPLADDAQGGIDNIAVSLTLQ